MRYPEVEVELPAHPEVPRGRGAHPEVKVLDGLLQVAVLVVDLVVDLGLHLLHLSVDVLLVHLDVLVQIVQLLAKQVHTLHAPLSLDGRK